MSFDNCFVARTKHATWIEGSIYVNVENKIGLAMEKGDGHD
jgi:hypothetical protein